MEIVRANIGSDGTFNNRDFDAAEGDNAETNITKLDKLYEANGYESLYERGTGTPEFESLSLAEQDAVRSGARDKTEFYDDFVGATALGNKG